MVSPQPSVTQSEAERERDVRSFLRVVDDFGSSAERFFERIYEGLRRKQTQQAQRPEPGDPVAALQRANRELTSRFKEAQTVAARLQAVFGRIDEGVIMQDTDGRLVLMNNAA